jgi:uncharacterized protein (DUF305 family)
MNMRACSSSGVLIVIVTTSLLAQRTRSADGASIVQPGAPGKASRVLSLQTVPVVSNSPAEADVSFMQGMIMHHAQAVEMTDLLRVRGHSKELLAFGERIAISQSDEIRSMKQWLTDRGQAVSAGSMHMGHDMSAMKGMTMPLMPGMLTPEQMQALAKANGKAFDHLFLTGMIQHHNGALAMVEDLFNTPGAGQESTLFDFANDIDNTQRAEIEIMQRMLLKEKR